MEGDRSAAREARRQLAVRVRTNWTWPNPPSPPSSPSLSSAELRPRFYASSASELDVESAPHTDPDPYQFDSPEKVGEVVGRREDARRRRRRKAFLEEVEWNEGLRYWAERRDAWTGVVRAREHQRVKSARETEKADGGAGEKRKESELSDVMEHVRLGAGAGGADGDYSSSTTKSTLPSSISDVDADSDRHSDAGPSPPPSDHDGLVPVAPPILPPTHPIRAAISPRTYPEIFDKVVSAGRTPSVPINLSDMVAALVAGWKRADEWPPRARPPDPLVGRRRKPPMKLGGPEGEFLAHHPHVKKGVEGVKKVFRLSGSGSHGSSDKVPDG